MEQSGRPRRGVVAAGLLAALTLLVATGTAPGAAQASRVEQPGALRVSAAQAAAPNTWRPAGRSDDARTGAMFAGLRQTARCAGGFEVEGSAGSCTHGPDPAPAGVDVRDVPTAAELAAQAGAGGDAAAAAGAVPCYGDGTTGKRIQVIYAVAADRTDRYGSVVDLIRGYAYNADQAFYNSAVRGGAVRHLRFVTDSSCRVVVDRVVLSPTGDDSLANTRAELRALGYTSNDRKYVVFADASVYCGISYVVGDDRPDASNPANSGATVSRIDSACWAGTTSVPAHEIAHGLGAVQLTSPNSNGSWHCTDEYDRLCYDDGSGASMTYVCASSQEPLLDCNGDDYFNVAPAPGSWLATHWNLANSMFLETAEPGAPPPTPTPTPTPTASPSRTPTPTASPSRTPTPTGSPSRTPTPTASPTTSPPAPSPTAWPSPTASPSPTVSPSPTASPRHRHKRRLSTTYTGRLTAGERRDSYRFTAGTGPLTARADVTQVRRLRVTVVALATGRTVLHRDGRDVLTASTTIRAGRYRLLVAAPHGARYRVRVTRAAG